MEKKFENVAYSYLFNFDTKKQYELIEIQINNNCIVGSVSR